MQENQSIWSRIVNYVKESKAELKKVQWPTKRETVNYTILVIAISLGVAIYLGAIDYILNIILEKVILGN